MLEPLALWVTPVSEPGGVSRHVLDVARAGIPGYRLAVLCPPGPLPDELRAVGAAVLTGPSGPDAVDDAAHGRAYGAVTTARAAAASSATLRHAVRTLRPAVVHSHLAYADLIAAAVLRGPRLPGAPGFLRAAEPGRGTGPALVSTEHGIAGEASVYHADPARARVMAELHARRLRRTDARIAVSRATARAMEQRWRARDVVVVRNGVDHVPRPSPRPVRGALRLLSLTRLAPEKNLEALLDAVVVLRRTHPDVRLTIAGDGPERDRVRHAVARRDLGDRVRLTGVVDAAAALAEHDAVVQLSRWENCSYTLLDAAAAGLGVVATDVGGNGEILPPRCLVPLDAPRLPETVADLVTRQLDPDSRPALPAQWPTVARMTEAVAEVYRTISHPPEEER